MVIKISLKLLESTIDEFLALKQIFKKLRPTVVKGITVTKFPRRSFFRKIANFDKKGMKRIIKFEAPFFEFVWCETKGVCKVKKRFQVQDIIEVIEGKQSLNFEKYPCAKKRTVFFCIDG